MNFEKTQTWNHLTGTLGNYYTESNESEREELRKFFKGVMKTSKAVVEFTKADGTVRIMNCTLSEDQGAKYTVKESTDSVETKKPNDNVCVIWDCDRSVWRSFRWDRLIRIEF